MTIGFATRSNLTILVLSAAALGTTGCELIPGLVSGGGGGTPDPTFTSAPLTVVVEQIDGTLDGASLEPTAVEATGLRSGLSLQFDVSIPSEGTSLTVFTPGADASSQNPYVGGAGDFGEPFPLDAGSPDDRAGPFEPSFDPNQAQVTVCSSRGECRDAEDFGLEIAQLAEGRTVMLDGIWSGGDQIHLEMRYHEQR